MIDPDQLERMAQIMDEKYCVLHPDMVREIAAEIRAGRELSKAIADSGLDEIGGFMDIKHAARAYDRAVAGEGKLA
jgi:hypothetical protein